MMTRWQEENLIEGIRRIRAERLAASAAVARWYALGARYEPFPAAYRGASQDGTDCRMAYNAGVIARLFGIDLSTVIN